MGQEFQMRFPAAKNFSKKTEKLFIATKTGWGGRGIPFYCPVRKTDDCLSLHSLSLFLYLSLCFSLLIVQELLWSGWGLTSTITSFSLSVCLKCERSTVYS